VLLCKLGLPFLLVRICYSLGDRVLGESSGDKVQKEMVAVLIWKFHDPSCKKMSKLENVLFARDRGGVTNVTRGSLWFNTYGTHRSTLRSSAKKFV
jgi:hypothetical protein